jgi:hydroxymethylpyrimidine/phosphomethylpyrimidine kinase
MTLPVALSIAGSDSGGGAGIQADLKTFQAFGVFGTTAITAITVQDTGGVHGVHAVPVEIVRRQIEVVVRDLDPAGCKTGMLATAELVEAVASSIRALGLRRYVLDPVMVATSGDRLLDRDAESAVTELLVPLAEVVTPNLDEARLLTGLRIEDEQDMRAAGERLLELGATAALVKGGHLHGRVVVDVLVDATGTLSWRRPRIETTSTHGTGCTVSAAIAAGFAHGRDLRQAVEDALDYVHRAMVSAPGLGRGGHGPLNHLVDALVTRRPQSTTPSG